MKSLRKTKIVGTIGPASENRLEELFNAGLNVTRVNYSHGSWDEQSEKTETICRLRKEMDIPVALLLDMKGPEIRTGMLYTGKNTKIQLKDGQKFTLVNDDIEGNEEKVSVTYKELYKDVQPGTKILIDDGAIELKVDEVVGKDIVCTVVHGNGLGSRKTMKFDKLIELLKEMETTIEAEENQTLLEKLNREELINTMQFLQRCAAQAGYYYNLQAPGSEFGTMKLQTAENDEPIVAQVKIWDNKEHKIRTRFSLRRLVTEEDGSLSVKLPC